MDTDLLSATTTTKAGSFISDTSADVVFRRGEEILGLPVVKDKTWNITAVITPAEAKAILLAMPTQRPLSRANVEYFQSVITSGRFKVTHQGIAFDKDGRLIDGQHRLTACVEADAAIEIQVTFNLDAMLFDSMDRGRNRNMADDLIVGAVTSNRFDGFLLSAGAKILWLLDAGRVPWQSVSRREFSITQMREVLDQHCYLHDAVSFCGKYQHLLRGIGAGVTSAFYTRFRETNYAKADLFMEQLVHGENLRLGDPVYALREYRRWSGNAHMKVNRAAMMIIIVRCWNAFVEGRQLSKVSSSMRSDSEVNFPTISKGK